MVTTIRYLQEPQVRSWSVLFECRGRGVWSQVTGATARCSLIAASPFTTRPSRPFSRLPRRISLQKTDCSQSTLGLADWANLRPRKQQRPLSHETRSLLVYISFISFAILNTCKLRIKTSKTFSADVKPCVELCILFISFNVPVNVTKSG